MHFRRLQLDFGNFRLIYITYFISQFQSALDQSFSRSYRMSLLKKRWKRKKVAQNFRNIFHLQEFLKESDSSIEKAVFWTSNFLSVPSSGKSLLNLKSSQDKQVRERLRKTKVVVNVGGERFVIPYKTISRYPDTLLATREIERYFDRRRKEYFFDRDPDMFR